MDDLPRWWNLQQQNAFLLLLWDLNIHHVQINKPYSRLNEDKGEDKWWSLMAGAIDDKLNLDENGLDVPYLIYMAHT